MPLCLHIWDSDGDEFAQADGLVVLGECAPFFLTVSGLSETVRGANVTLFHNDMIMQQVQCLVARPDAAAAWSCAQPTTLHSGKYVAVGVDDDSGNEERSNAVWLVVNALSGRHAKGAERVLHALMPLLALRPNFRFDAASGVLRLLDYGDVALLTAATVYDANEHFVYVFDGVAQRVFGVPLRDIGGVLCHDLALRRRRLGGGSRQQLRQAAAHVRQLTATEQQSQLPSR